jgi:hypothetical protein
VVYCFSASLLAQHHPTDNHGLIKIQPVQQVYKEVKLSGCLAKVEP